MRWIAKRFGGIFPFELYSVVALPMALQCRERWFRCPQFIQPSVHLKQAQSISSCELCLERIQTSS